MERCGGKSALFMICTVSAIVFLCLALRRIEERIKLQEMNLEALHTAVPSLVKSVINEFAETQSKATVCTNEPPQRKHNNTSPIQVSRIIGVLQQPSAFHVVKPKTQCSESDEEDDNEVETPTKIGTHKIHTPLPVTTPIKLKLEKIT